MPEGTGGPRRFHACACGNRQVCPKFLDAFGVSICSVCKADESLVSKSKAVERYLLTERELRPLGSLLRQSQIRTRAFSRKRRAAAQEREERAAAAKLQKVEEGVRAAREAPEVHVHTFVDD